MYYRRARWLQTIAARHFEHKLYLRVKDKEMIVFMIVYMTLTVNFWKKMH